MKQQPTLDAKLIVCTPHAEELLMFTKDTRLLSGPDAFQKKFELKGEERQKEFAKVFSSISSPLEFVDYIFLITNVTRAFTHQLVRHRVGVSFAQQAQRVVDMSGFGYMVPDSFMEGENSDEFLPIYELTMERIQEGYQELIGLGARAQDARGVLPTNVHTNILFKVNLRAMLEMAHIRLCVRAQGEFQQIALKIREKASRVHPWVADRMGPMCISKGICAFPVFDRCPIKAERPWLNGPPQIEIQAMRGEWEGLMGKYDPQPLGDGK